MLTFEIEVQGLLFSVLNEILRLERERERERERSQTKTYTGSQENPVQFRVFLSMEWKGSRQRRVNKELILISCTFIIFFYLVCAFLTTIVGSNGTTPTEMHAGISIWSPFPAKPALYDFQGLKKVRRATILTTEKKGISWITARRLLGRLGSGPPKCASKCGRCTPCRPVHVAVPPGTPVTAEYYPEAWRCKCGNRLYIP